MNNESKRMWKEAVLALFKELSQHLPGGTEENHKKLSQDSQSLDRLEPRTSQIRSRSANHLILTSV
jgi:hypothetical protein